MKNIQDFTLLNNIPTIVMTNEGLEAIKHIVSIAPQEAQWFNTVEPIEYKQSPGEIFLHLSTKLYIPKQNTSAAQVDSNGTMMMEFYNELKQDHTLDEVNNIISNMNCWSHSHHKMSPNPSHQDDLQFNKLVTLSQDQGLKKWQIMLIFNKSNNFYSRVYNPHTGLIYEGVEIIVQDNYDFSYIDKAAKEKFIKPKPKYNFNNKKYKKPLWHNMDAYSSLNPSYNLFNDHNPYNKIDEVAYVNDQIALDIIGGVFDAPSASSLIGKVYKYTPTLVDNLYESFQLNMDEKELNFFIYLMKGDSKSILKTYTDYGFKTYGIKLKDLAKEFKSVFSEKVDLSEIHKNIIHTLEVSDCTSKKECETMLNALFA